MEVDDQPEHRILLCRRSGVGYAAIGIQSALIADADGVGVGSTGMRTHSLYRTALMYLAVARNIIMIADVKPAVHFHMVVAQLLYCVRVIAAATAAMHHNHINLSHSLSIKPDNPLLNPGGGSLKRAGRYSHSAQKGR